AATTSATRRSSGRSHPRATRLSSSSTSTGRSRVAACARATSSSTTTVPAASRSRRGATIRAPRRRCYTKAALADCRCRLVRGPGCGYECPPMQTRRLGALEVPAIGLGCMGMSEFYGPSDETEAIGTIHRAIDLGVTLLDTADMYGPFTNEELVGRAIRGRRDQVVLATKCGIVRDQSNLTIRGIDGSPAYILMACEASLKRLGVDHVDLYHLHRIGPKVPVEGRAGATAAQ